VRLTPPARFGGGRTHTPRRCDGAYPTERRLDEQTVASLSGLKKLLCLWKRQKGLCLVCRQKVTKQTGWQSHHLIWRSHGGSDGVTNLALFHPECHQRVHSQNLVVMTPRL
jgi:RNA-directed DNA polymerase